LFAIGLAQHLMAGSGELIVRMLLNFTARRWLMLAPALAVIGVLFAGGLALAAAQSLGYFAPTGENTLTLRHYVSLGDEREIYA